ncbi:sulfotransferase 1 family member D1-like [Rhinophrynus dorsalis]
MRSTEDMDFTSIQTIVPLHGIPMMKGTVDNWDLMENFQARPDDIVISTYPKAGTTWVSEIVDMIYNDGDSEKCRRDTIYNRIPFMEFRLPGLIAGVEKLKTTPSPRIIKTHLPIKLMPKSFWEKNCKVIYVARNAKDVAVSYFFFHKMAKTIVDPGPWDKFLDNYIKGDVCYGSWHDHVKGWWKKRQDYHILYLFYEDIKEDPKREIKKIAHFLDKELSEEILEKTVHHTSFQEMKNNNMVNYTTVPVEMMDHTISPFMRKGETGDWKNHFTVAQNEKFEEDYQRQMSGEGLHFRTEI